MSSKLISEELSRVRDVIANHIGPEQESAEELLADIVRYLDNEARGHWDVARFTGEVEMTADQY